MVPDNGSEVCTGQRAWNYRRLTAKSGVEQRSRKKLIGRSPFGTLLRDRPASWESRILQRRNASAGFQLVLTIAPSLARS